MSWTLSLYTICGFVAATVTAGTLWFVRDARSEPHWPAFVGLLVAASGWALAYAIQLGHATAPAQMDWLRIAICFAGPVPTLWFLFSVRYVGADRWLTRRRVALLALEPILFCTLVLTNARHSIMWTATGLTETGWGPVLSISLGPGYVVLVGYAYVIVSVGIVILFREFVRSSTLYRRQIGLLILGGLPSMLTHVLFTLRAGPIPDLDLTPFALSITAVFFGLTIFHYDLVDRSPVAREQAFQRMGDGLIVADADGVIVEVNDVARRVFDSSPTEGRQVDVVFGDGDLDGLDGRTLTATIGGTERSYDCHVTPFYDHHDRLTGRGVVLRDVTDRRAYEQRLEVANRVLRHNLRNDMTVILGRADELESSVDDGQREAVHVIQDTVEDIMAVSEKAREMIQHTRFAEVDRESVDVVTVAERALATFRTAHPTVAWRFAAPESAHAFAASEEALATAVENLLENAVEHNDADRPEVTVTVAAAGDAVRLSVADNGSGIPDLEQDVFVSGTETQLKHSQGLGLWLVYWSVSASGGEVSIHTDDGSGSRVTITLPATDDAEPATNSPPADSETRHSSRTATR
ncbi:histidine kinase N-terminal 7TM domain-containing protein [Halorientalis halophila]|uniref:histidine kinase N-terminal 7TM domain-containing protein n=1 Tax=Halorientalis halophila TaxID=3108499 RepID=UPI003009DABC